MDLGLGKTVTTLTAISDLMDSFECKRVLIVAPLRVAKKVWSDEVAAWKHLKHLQVARVVGDVKQRTRAAQSSAPIHTINVENIGWLEKFFGGKLPYDLIVLDESSMFKSRATERFKVMRRIAARADRVIELTATPAPNNYIDLWSQFYILDGGRRLGLTITGYKTRYFDQLDRDGYKFALKKGAKEVIHHHIDDITMTMKKEDYLKMPPLIVRKHVVEFDDKLMAAYDQFERDLVMQIDADTEIEAVTAAALATKLMQFSNGQLYDEDKNVHAVHSEKVEALRQIIDEAQSPVLVAYSFKSDRDRLLAEFPQAVALGKDTRLLDRWNRGEVPVLLVHPASAGHGLNLQHGGNHLVWYGLTWSLELYQQLTARLHRQGQEKPVFAHHIIAKGTIDETVMSVLARKDAAQEGLLAAMKKRLAYVA
jgi:SNF2 family DNA or RNA helicase